MHLPVLVEQQARTNRWADRHPFEKVTAAAVGIALAAHPGAPWMPLAVAAAAVVWVRRAGVPLAVLGHAALMPIGFLLAASVPLAVSLRETPGAWWPVPQVDAASLGLAAHTLVRAMAVLTCTLALALTTPVDDLAWLAGRAGVPMSVVHTGLAVHRFLFHFTRTLATLHAAQRARLGFVGWQGTVRSLGLISANLFGQSMAGAEALARGVAARGGLSFSRRHHHPCSVIRLALIIGAGVLAAVAGAVA